MNTMKIQHFFVNVLCGLFYKKQTRLLLRLLLNSPVLEQIRFIKKDSKIRHPRIHFYTGYRGRNLVISVNKKYVYKFQSVNVYEIAQKEKVITTEFSKISNINIPIPQILKYKHGIVKKYKFIHGKSLCRMTDTEIEQISPTIAPTVAKFLFEIGNQDPKNLFKYKNNPDDKPGYMYGWCQGDIGDNLIIDKNSKISAIIDWEDARFYDFSKMFNADKRKSVYNFMQQVKKHYDIMYNKTNKDI